MLLFLRFTLDSHFTNKGFLNIVGSAATCPSTLHDLRMSFHASDRALKTDVAIIDRVMADYLKPGVLNLAQGSAYFAPPPITIQQESLPQDSRYGDVAGYTQLRSLLREKLALENNIYDKEITVTAGANQAFLNTAMALCNNGDSAILFKPYYFSHKMTLQLLGVDSISVNCDPETFEPDLDHFIEMMDTHASTVKMVVLVTPGNPSGCVIEKNMCDRILKACQDRGVWLVVDEAYEHFVFDGATHYSPTAQDGVVNIFTFSKSYSLAGWRVGYMVYPKHLHDSVLKIQDTVPTHACILSQKIALDVIRHFGRSWIDNQVKLISETRKVITSELKEFLPHSHTRGAFYLFLRLPDNISDDTTAIKMLAEKYQVLVTPGSAFGMQGYIRVSYASADSETVAIAAKKLREGLGHLQRMAGTGEESTLPPA